MKMDSEEQGALKDAGTCPTPIVHPSDDQGESVEPAKLLDPPRDVVRTKKTPMWL